MKNQVHNNLVKQKYNTLYQRVSKAVQTGRFSTYTNAKKQSLYNRLKRYERRLKHWGIAIASATALFLAPMTATGQAAIKSGGEFQVNTYTTDHQRGPSIAMDNNGNYVIVWDSNGQDGNGQGIYGQRYNNTGTKVGAEFLINTTTTGSQRSASIAMDSDGDFVVTWRGPDGSSEGIFGQRYNNTGVKVGAEFQVNTYTPDSQALPSVAMDSDGDFVVIWQSSRTIGLSNSINIYGQRYNNTGAAVGSEFQVNTYTTYNQRFPSVAMDSDGDFVVTWESRNQDGNNYGIYGQRYNNTGATVGAEFLINTTTANIQSYSEVAMDSDGDFVVVWKSSFQDGSEMSIFGQRYNNTGATVGAEFQVNTHTTDRQRIPAIAMDSDGDFVVTWTSRNQDGDGYGIYGQQYDNTGATVGAEFHVSTTTNGEQHESSVAMNSDGGFVVAWEDYGNFSFGCFCDLPGQDGNAAGVFAQQYGVPITIPTTANTYTAAAVETNANGYSTYTDISGNILMKIKAPAGVTIPASAIKIKVGATASTYYNQYCGGSRNGGCFVRKTAGNALINRFWDIDKTQITGGTISSATPIDLVFYFTQADFDAINTALTNNGQSALSNFTDLQAYVVKNTAALSDFPSPTDIGNYRKVYRLSNNTTASTTKWKLENPSTGIYSMEMKVIRIDNGGGLGVFF